MSTTYPVPYVGPVLSFFLGSMEILRRAMWGIFRVEYEHTKFMNKKVLGFQVIHKHTHPFRKTIDNYGIELPVTAL